MSDSVLHKFAARRSGADDSLADESDSADDLGAFGWLRGAQRDRALMLELRFKDGSAEALAYAWLERATFHPSEGILLRFGGQSVRIVGRNLAAEARPNVRLFDGLLRHRIGWIREMDHVAQITAAKEAVVIEQVQIT